MVFDILFLYVHVFRGKHVPRCSLSLSMHAQQNNPAHVYLYVSTGAYEGKEHITCIVHSIQ